MAQMAQMNGDLILGGLFPMHEHNASRMEQPCGAIKEEKGIQVSYCILANITVNILHIFVNIKYYIVYSLIFGKLFLHQRRLD